MASSGGGKGKATPSPAGEGAAPTPSPSVAVKMAWVALAGNQPGTWLYEGLTIGPAVTVGGVAVQRERQCDYRPQAC